MLTISQLKLERTTKKNMTRCHVLGLKELERKNLPKDFPSKLRKESFRYFKGLVSCSPRNKKHIAHLVVFDNSKPYGRRRVWLRCNCEYFKFKCEYVLDRRGSTTRKYAIRKPPTVTNPRGIPYICKHLYMLILLVRSRV